MLIDPIRHAKFCGELFLYLSYNNTFMHVKLINSKEQTLKNSNT